MKKGILALIALLNGTLLMAQAEFDALKFIQPDINGTARYMSMAGAFGALGGDVSGIKDNPAGLGIFQKSQVVATGNFSIQNTTANWYNIQSTDNLSKIGYNNFSGVYVLPLKKGEDEKGLLNCNFSFSYNRLKNFNRKMTIKGQSNMSSLADYIDASSENIDISKIDLGDIEDLENIKATDLYNSGMPWLYLLAINCGVLTEQGTSTLGPSETVIPSYSLTEKGYIDEYSLSCAANYSNFIYLGATANIQAINYTAISKYSEVYSVEGNLNLLDTISTKGKGISFNIGTIISPLKFLRVGLSVHTPTLYALTDIYHATLKKNDTISTSAPEGTNKYKLSNPMQLSASIAYLLGEKAKISIEYDYNIATGTKLMDEKGIVQDSGFVNLRMNEKYNNIYTVKFGGEFNINDNISVRAGYAFSNNATKPEEEIQPAKMSRYYSRTDTEYFLHNSTNYITFGLGYHKANWSVDIAYMNRTIKETFYPYDSNYMASKIQEAKLTTLNNNLAVTFGYKF